MVAVSKRYAAPAKPRSNAKPRPKQVAAGPGRPGPTRLDANALLVDTVRRKPLRHRATSPEDFKTSLLNIRVKKELKTQATAALEKMGISLAEAVRVFLGRVVSDNAFPFPLHVPNAETEAALRDSMASDHKRASDQTRYSDVEEMFDDLEKGGVR